jgi:hypothetical protein
MATTGSGRSPKSRRASRWDHHRSPLDAPDLAGALRVLRAGFGPDAITVVGLIPRNEQSPARTLAAYTQLCLTPDGEEDQHDPAAAESQHQQAAR